VPANATWAPLIEAQIVGTTTRTRLCGRRRLPRKPGKYKNHFLRLLHAHYVFGILPLGSFTLSFELFYLDDRSSLAQDVVTVKNAEGHLNLVFSMYSQFESQCEGKLCREDGKYYHVKNYSNTQLQDINNELLKIYTRSKQWMSFRMKSDVGKQH
jgi:hypothetical protein